MEKEPVTESVDLKGQMELRVKVAELRGYYTQRSLPGMGTLCEDHSIGWRDLPDFCNDLNACAEFERTLSWEQGVRYRIALAFNSDGRNAIFPSVEAALCHATAEQRCRAFVEVMGGRSVGARGQPDTASFKSKILVPAPSSKKKNQDLG